MSKREEETSAFLSAADRTTPRSHVPLRVLGNARAGRRRGLSVLVSAVVARLAVALSGGALFFRSKVRRGSEEQGQPIDSCWRPAL